MAARVIPGTDSWVAMYCSHALWHSHRLSVGVIAVGIYVTIGIFIGAFAGYFVAEWTCSSNGLSRFLWKLTLIVILVLISFIDKPSIFHIMLVIGLFRWTGVALGAW